MCVVVVIRKPLSSDLVRMKRTTDLPVDEILVRHLPLGRSALEFGRETITAGRGAMLRREVIRAYETIGISGDSPNLQPGLIAS